MWFGPQGDVMTLVCMVLSATDTFQHKMGFFLTGEEISFSLFKSQWFLMLAAGCYASLFSRGGLNPREVVFPVS